MPRNKVELKVQSDLVKSVKRDGGWARKLSHQFMIGLPDLLVSMYPFAPFLAEVKDMGQVPAIFRRVIPVSEKQRHELEQFDLSHKEGVDRDTLGNAGERYASVLIVGWAWGTVRWVAMLPWDATHLDSSLLYSALPIRTASVKRETGGYYDVRTLAEQFGELHQMRLL